MNHASIRHTVAHVPGFGSLGLDREPFSVRICARLRWRAHGEITKRTNPARHPSVAARSGNWIASRLHAGAVLRRTVEPARTPTAPVLRIFVRGQRTILNLCRAFKAAGKPSFLRALVQHPEKSGRSVAYRFQFSPAFRSSVAAHVPNMMQKDARSHEQCTREYE